jgi:hypothetical protein
MPRFTPNQANVQSTFPVYPKGEYELILGEPKAFLSSKDNATSGETSTNYGIRIAATIAEGEFKGKSYIINLYMHSEGAEKYSKGVVMAAYGYDATEEAEKAFNVNVAAQKDQGFDTDNGWVGNYWADMKGNRLTIALDERQDPNNAAKKQQVVKGYFPVATVAA